LTITQTIDRPMLAPPGVPPARVKELRDALAATVRDPAFLAEAAKRKLHLDLTPGEEMAKTLRRIYASPPELIAAAKKTMGGR
jgi:tripartite-type tricarboxylate transporter receptor subunit TctC